MAFGKISFDIYGQIEGRWSVYSQSKYREAAIEEAKELLGTGDFEAVKVVREDERSGEEETVFSEESKKKPKGLTVVPIEEAPLCEALEDAYAFEARKMTSRVLRKYLDEHGMTAFELMHDYGKIKSFTRNEDFLTKAVHAIARAQSKGTDVKHYERVDTLFSMIEQMTDRAESIEGDNRYYDLFKNLVWIKCSKRSTGMSTRKIKGSAFARRFQNTWARWPIGRPSCCSWLSRLKKADGKSVPVHRRNYG